MINHEEKEIEELNPIFINFNNKINTNIQLTHPRTYDGSNE